jgi:hypothetical protein
MAERTAVHPEDNQPTPNDGIHYHVVPNGEHWDVLRNGRFIGTVVSDLDGAIDHAVAVAQRDHHDGHETSVCVEEQSGHCRHVWP